MYSNIIVHIGILVLEVNNMYCNKVAFRSSLDMAAICKDTVSVIYMLYVFLIHMKFSNDS